MYVFYPDFGGRRRGVFELLAAALLQTRPDKTLCHAFCLQFEPLNAAIGQELVEA